MLQPRRNVKCGYVFGESTEKIKGLNTIMLHEKRLKKYEDNLMELRDNMKQNNIQIIGIPEREENEEGIETLFQKIMTENFLNLGEGKIPASSGSTESPN